MIRRLAPSWVYASAFALAAVAGSVNAVAWLGTEHRGITHVTGALTETSTRLANGDLAAAGHTLLVIGAFLAGSTLSGLLIHSANLELGRRYGVGLVLEGALLVAAWHARVDGRIPWADYFAAAACGLQNALATSFSGAVVRTTHMTGVVTDLGLLLGHALRGEVVDRGRAWLYLALLAGFFTGGAFGAVASARLGPSALLLPAAAVTLGGVAYWIWLTRRRT